jgi:zinc protease
MAISLVVGPAWAQDRALEGATVEGITEHTLPNGLQVLLFPDASKPTITVNITYFVGSRHEGYGETGMAHLLEHLLFKGSPKHPDIPQELTEHGSRPNGTTWYDRTNYFETFTATEENLEWALDLEADRMVNSFVSAEDLESEMTVVRNEFEMGENSPFGVLMERTFSTAFLWHNYGQSTIGARSDIENVLIERLQAFYRRYYQPDNAVLVVAGKFDPAETLELVEQKFGAIPRPDRSNAPLYSTYTAEPTQDGERSVTLRRVGDVQIVMSTYHLPAGTHPDFAALDVLGEVLGSEPSGRLYKALVEPKKAANIGSFAFQLREPGVLLSFAEVRLEGSLDSAKAILTNVVESVAAQAPTAEEVDRAKTSLLKNIELALNSSSRIGRQLSEWASMGDWRMLFIHRDRIKEVTQADVQRVAALYLKPSNRTIGEFIPTEGPDRAEIPPIPDITDLVAAYRGDTTRSAGEEFDPSPSNIEARTVRSSLPSGFKLALLQKTTRGGSVVVSATLRFGTEGSLMNRATAAGLAGGMLMRGTTTHTRQEIKDEFDRLKAQVSVSGGATSANIRIETTRENLPDVLRLLGEVLREPAFDAKEFDELKEAQLASLEEQKSEPIPQAMMALGRHLRPYPEGHPSHTMTFDERIEAITNTTLDELKSFYNDFYGVGAGELAVVGDFDPAVVGDLVNQFFGEWRSPSAFTRIPSKYFVVPAENRSLETPDKANAVFVAGQNLQLRDDDPDYPALVLGNYMLGGGFLNSRLATRIRQEEGLSYGVGSQFFASAVDRYGQFFGFAIYAPENAEALEAAFKEEIEKVLTEGYTDDEVAAAKAGYLQSRQVSRAQDSELASLLSRYLFVRRNLSFDAGVEEQIANLTSADILAAMKRHIDLAKLSIVKAGDFAKLQPAADQP